MKRKSANLKPDEIMTVYSLAGYPHCHTSTVLSTDLRERKIPGF
jgi:hypothetical protein